MKVKRNDFTIEEFDRQRVVDCLVKEGQTEIKARHVAEEVESRLGNKREVTSDIIRSYVNCILWERGDREVLELDTKLGISVKDLDSLLLNGDNENANIPHSPEALNLKIAEKVQAEYMMKHVFDKEVAEAHLVGDLHVHDAGFPRPYCGGNNPSYVAKFGYSTDDIIAKPAKNPIVLVEHIIKWMCSLQSNFAGAVGIDALNTMLSPIVVGLSYKEIKQLCQVLVFELAQQRAARGGQVIFSDLNFYWNCPDHFAKTKAVGLGGKMLDKTYGQFEKEGKEIVKAMCEVYYEGDGAGHPFMFPKPMFHFDDKTVEEEEYLEVVCNLASKFGTPYFLMDRGKAQIAQCCRLVFDISDTLDDAKEPWKMRYSGLQNVTINLPALQLKKGNFFDNMKEALQLAFKAHMNKYDFLWKIMQRDPSMLDFLKRDLDGTQYFRWDRTKLIFGVIGLDDCIRQMKGSGIRENINVAQSILMLMAKYVDDLGKQHGYSCVLEQTPAESAANRLAKLNVKRFGDKAVVYGEGEGVYLTNSSLIPFSEDVGTFERLEKETNLHKFYSAGAISHVWTGETLPDKEALKKLVKKVYYNTDCIQLAVSPEFTICNDCSNIELGLHDCCSECKSLDIDGMTRVTGYFSKTSRWNPGKISELNERKRVEII